ncbi:MAG: endonuclease [Bacteroidaceae bacterium]|nr:endonuclease [Bacteroidaceae bacterium]
MGDHFNAFVESQKQGPKEDGTYKLKGITTQGAANLREETSHILAHCNPHDGVNNPETTHLVVGYVQSGKTMSFTALTALALDNGYRVVIYLAGTKNNLLNQTAKRLEKDLIGGKSKNRNYYRLHIDPNKDEVDQIVGHLSLNSHPIILIPILKHWKHINNLVTILTSPDFKEAMEGETALIIDDEADQASLNSYGRYNSRVDADGYTAEERQSKTYESILKMRAVLPGNTYIQYTATPQANLLISMQDLLSPKSHTLLTPGEDYIGGKLFFGKGKNHDLFRGALIYNIPDDEVFHKKYNRLYRIPKSLKDALMLHILAVAIVVKYLKVDGIEYLSMMVHPDNTIIWNKTFKDWIDAELIKWRRLLRQPDGEIDKEEMMVRFKQLYKMATAFYEEFERPSFNEIKELIPEVLNDYKTYLVNTDSEAETDIDWNRYSMHILVGAEMLNRGFTVEKLATTYMPRYTKGLSNADTIQQRCRFFGYKKDYIKSCKVFLPSWTIKDYLDYVDHEEELRSTLESCDTLEQAERKILLSPRLRPTRSNVLPISVVNTKLKGMHGLQAFESKERIESNKSIVESFLSKHEKEFVVNTDYTTEDRTHRWLKLQIEDAIEFLESFRFGSYKDAARKASTIRYLRYLSGSDNPNALSFVYFIQMAYAAPVRRRSFDKNTLRLAANTDIFAGPSSVHDSTNYPGDRKIFGEDSITIQLHHIYLDGAELEYPHEAYTLAINYPEQLAINYCANESSKQDEEDDDYMI